MFIDSTSHLNSVNVKGFQTVLISRVLQFVWYNIKVKNSITLIDEIAQM